MTVLEKTPDPFLHFTDVVRCSNGETVVLRTLIEAEKKYWTDGRVFDNGDRENSVLGCV